MHANLQLIGLPTFTEVEQDFARRIQNATGLEEKGVAGKIEPLEASKARDLDTYIGQASTDVAEVTLITPTVGLSVTT